MGDETTKEKTRPIPGALMRYVLIGTSVTSHVIKLTASDVTFPANSLT